MIGKTDWSIDWWVDRSMDWLNLTLACTCSCLWIVPYELWDNKFSPLFFSITLVKLSVFLFLWSECIAILNWCIVPHRQPLVQRQYTKPVQINRGLDIKTAKSTIFWQRFNTLIIANGPKFWLQIVFSRNLGQLALNDWT